MNYCEIEDDLELQIILPSPPKRLELKPCVTHHAWVILGSEFKTRKLFFSPNTDQDALYDVNIFPYGRLSNMFWPGIGGARL